MPKHSDKDSFLTIRLPREDVERCHAAARSDQRSTSNWVWLILSRELERIEQAKGERR